MVFHGNVDTFIASGAGFILVGNGETAMRATFGAPCPNPGKVNNIAMSNGSSSVGVGISGGNGIGYSFDIRNVNVSTRMFVAVDGKSGGTSIAVDPGFDGGGLALGKGVVPLSRSGVFGKHS